MLRWTSIKNCSRAVAMYHLCEHSCCSLDSGTKKWRHNSKRPMSYDWDKWALNLSVSGPDVLTV